MRSLGLAIAGLFGGWLLATAVIGAFRALTLAATGAAAPVPFVLRFAPEVLAVLGAVLVPVLAARARARREARR
ncbi:hypothetical protein Bcav_4004 [Beutenbergia cavernae DSM 12333]|uniref:Uncharacterized protein n=1 Tax=Beutenbergia cavernae (strain ATCC BAA-8 / DSM 12333 / CCUG 43141 / JCM 11478 / NBRC 16432 / NCIMB 13614 / HKI 0122) TaxID=471853 RepID=C5C5A5_BEUC1|nr:hypothetical protein [Beutenbergia cavernae]ACQ82245.1 hypothetical protein Bcav_4004 [Beutenbergia cavernae DSM 12333]